MTSIQPDSPAVIAAKEVDGRILECVKKGRSFVLEAGAGAGKTYSLVEVLRHVLRSDGRRLLRKSQRVACITYTNVAKDQIEERLDGDPALYCDTNHGFCWGLISQFKAQILAILPEVGEKWQARIQEYGDISACSVDYSRGFPKLEGGIIQLGHEDIMPLTTRLMKNEKFIRVWAARYPIVFVDEYQDTDESWMQAVKDFLLGKPAAPLFGFFGDHWQKIYDDGCGQISHDAVDIILKGSNFRSSPAVVGCLNRMRPGLTQEVKDPCETGSVRVFHTNGWCGERETGPHTKGDLPRDIAKHALDRVRDILAAEGWDLSAEKCKILMLTHKVLAQEQGYPGINAAFSRTESYVKKEDPHVAFFADQLEPAIKHYQKREYAEMFAALGLAFPTVRSHRDKAVFSKAMDHIILKRESGTVADVINAILRSDVLRLPQRVLDRERELTASEGTEEELPSYLKSLRLLRDVDYAEVRALCAFLEGHSPFQTKHGVKGDEFENVVVVVGRGWNKYNFGEMLAQSRTMAVPKRRWEIYERSRNLFYVSCSRAQKNLALVFTELLSDDALDVVSEWFGKENVQELDLAD